MDENWIVQLREALDEVWGRLPVEEVLDMAGSCPELVDVCRYNHELVSHGVDRHRAPGQWV